MKVDKHFISEIALLKKSLFKEIEKAVVGQKPILEQLLISIISKGHTIIIGVPGLAKTLIIKSLAGALDLTYNRIQFTPDLMPSDITGSEIIQDTSKGKREFKFIPGPIFTNILLADEINRTPPKTQSALLQSMQEKIVTVNGKTYPLDDPFFVLATQNPIEQEGTYPLPEAQLDRFLFSVYIDYPDEQMEKEIANKDTSINISKIKKVIKKEKILQMQEAIDTVPISDFILNYAVHLVRLTRPEKGNPVEQVKQFVKWGAGPRATQFLVHAARTKTLLDGRYSVSREDINSCASNVLNHRIITNFTADAEGVRSENILEAIISHLNKKQK